MYCSVCGMTLPMFYRTNHAADHDHIHDQYCSITCMIEDAIVNGLTLATGTHLTEANDKENRYVRELTSPYAYTVNESFSIPMTAGMNLIGKGYNAYKNIKFEKNYQKLYQLTFILQILFIILLIKL